MTCASRIPYILQAASQYFHPGLGLHPTLQFQQVVLSRYKFIMPRTDVLPFRRPFDQPEGYYVTHPNGQISHYYLDTYTDPWLPAVKKPIIMLNHGCARTCEMWYHWVPRLSRDFVVIRRDNRGHGKSSFPKRLSPWSDQDSNNYENGYKWDLDTMLLEIVDMLDQLGIEKLIFFGEATSGEIGHAFAAKYPERVEALITCSSPTMLPPAAIDLFTVGESSWPEAVIKLGAKGWNAALGKNPGTLPTAKGSGYREWLLSETGKTPREGLAGYVIFLTSLTSRPYLEHQMSLLDSSPHQICSCAAE